MINKIKRLLKENKERQKKIIAQNEELLWASIFHDSIKGKKGIENLPLNIGKLMNTLFYVMGLELFPLPIMKKKPEL